MKYYVDGNEFTDILSAEAEAYNIIMENKLSFIKIYNENGEIVRLISC
jgi:hypothetical protein